MWQERSEWIWWKCLLHTANELFAELSRKAYEPKGLAYCRQEWTGPQCRETRRTMLIGRRVLINCGHFQWLTSETDPTMIDRVMDYLHEHHQATVMAV